MRLAYFFQRLIFNGKLCLFIGCFCLIVLSCVQLNHHVQQHYIRNFEEYQRSLRFVNPKVIVEEKWRMVGNPSLRHKIFSAIFDNRLAAVPDIYSPSKIPYGSVKIFGVLPLHIRGSDDFTCIFRLKNVVWPKNAVEVYPIHENFNMKFSAYTIVCPLTVSGNQSTVLLPEEVAVTYDANPETYASPTFIPIRYPKSGILAKPSKGLSVCISPLHSNYENVLRLVEFIEMFQILGAEKFYFYNLSISNEMSKTLEHYQNLGVVEVLQWDFHDYEQEEEVRNNGIFVAVNECVYRAALVDGFKYTAIVDTDEILMPLKHNTLLDLLAEVDNNATSSFIFRGVFLHGNHRNDTSSVPQNALNKFLYTQVKIQRTSDPFPVRQRSKYIVRGEMALELGNHFLWRGIHGTYERTLPVTEALLFHYRTNCVPYSCDAPLTLDYHARRFGTLIWDKVDHVCRSIFDDGICPLRE